VEEDAESSSITGAIVLASTAGSLLTAGAAAIAYYSIMDSDIDEGESFEIRDAEAADGDDVSEEASERSDSLDSDASDVFQKSEEMFS